MRKKRIVTKCLLFSLLLTSILFWQITERYQAASSYDNALEFFNSTGNNSGKHIECYNGNIYFGTSAKLAHTYASGGHKYYNTLGYDVTLTGGGTSLTFSVKRGGSLKEVPGSSRVDKNGYEYLLYCISREKIEDLAKKADPVNAATVFEAAEIKVRMDAIVTVRQNGVQGSIVEDGKGGITEYEANGAIYHLKNEWELEDIKEVFPGHKFESYFDIYDTLRNFSLEVYYGANGKPALSESSSTVVTNNKYKYANVTIKDVYVPYALGDGTKLYVTTSRLLNSFYLLKPSDISMVKEGYHLDTNAEWITKDDMVVSANAIQDPKKLIPSAGLQNEKLVLYANWKPNTYYVEYYANGGTGTMSKTTAT